MALHFVETETVKKRRFTMHWTGLILMLALILAPALHAATTGKIAGRITDKETGEPLPGANVIVRGTNFGAAADPEGEFYILNLPPGKYDIEVQMMGYSPVRMENVRVNINSTSNLNFELSMQVIEGQVVTVTADPISFKKDQTSAVRHVSSDDIEVLPLESMQDVVEMQAGVVDGHFRGGRLDEVSYLIDGMQVDDSFGGVGRTVNIENDVIEDLEIITGTFNAEYGRAMSGIVNAVTKDGGQGYHGSISGLLGNYYTPHKEIFIGLKDSDIARNRDIKAQLEGPLLRNRLSFFVNLRYQDLDNHLNGIRRFKVDDYSNYSMPDASMWIDTHNGDSSYVPMNDSNVLTLFSKLTFRPANSLKLSLIYSRNDQDWGNYNHSYKYNPEGVARSYKENNMIALQLNHTLGRNMFYEFKLSQIDDSNSRYLYESPRDSRYVHDIYAGTGGPGFVTGGQDKGHRVRELKDLNVKYDITWQAQKNHSLKAGFLLTEHDLNMAAYSIRNKYYSDPRVYQNYFDAEKNTYVYPYYEPEIFGDSTAYGEEYNVKPREFSAYLQDKMEFNEMVINMGVRYDYFDPNTVYPSNLRNPANQLNFPDDPEQMSNYPAADPKYQISPRFGLSYQLSNTALLHFSYGHFFQAPPMYAFYQNNSFLVVPTDYQTQMGNPQLKAQRTVQYEVGLWQELFSGMGIEVNLFYRDIYDLLSMKTVSTYNQIIYGLYTNKDYGNVKGLELKYDVRAGRLAAFVNYTLQYTRGNADDPLQNFTRAGESADPISRLIPLSWDQRHTLNLTLSYSAPQYSATLTGYFDSGTPYTWAPITESRLYRVNLYPNNSVKPSAYRFDFYGYYDVPLNNRFKLRLSVLAENLLDRKNEVWVNGNTGHANEAIIRPNDLANHRSLFNDYQDRINNPTAFSTPRYIKFGFGLFF